MTSQEKKGERARKGTRERTVDRIAAILRDRILSGEYRSGEWLPAERDLTGELGVHRRVVRAAIVLLEDEGFLVRRPNCRPVVELPRDESADGSQPEDSPYSPARTISLLMWRGGGVFEAQGTAQSRILSGMNRAIADYTGDLPFVAEFLDLDRFGTEEENAAREADNLRSALRRGVSGVVFYPYAVRSNHALIRSVAGRMPVVLIDRYIQGLDVDYVGVQNQSALYDATNHLIRLGHQRIAFVTLPQAVNPVTERMNGYLLAVQEAFGAASQEMVLMSPSVDAQSWLLLEAAFRLPVSQRPTAAVCVNDHMTVRLLERLDAMGLRVPTDVSVVGFDDLISKLPNGVGLTTMAQPYEEIGRTAADLILQRGLRQPRDHAYLELPCRLIERGSTCPPRSSS